MKAFVRAPRKLIVVVGVMFLMIIVLVEVAFDYLVAQMEPFPREPKLTAEISGKSTTLGPTRQYKIAIAIVSSYDWQESPPRASSYMRRQMHRDTWMQHPAVQNGTVLVYFVIGNQQVPGIQGNPKDATHNISELQSEIDHYGDVVLLNSSDVHDYGKMNAWYEWAPWNIQADYHMKLDDESYLLLDRLLHVSKKWPRHKFLGGQGQRLNRKYLGKGKELKNLSWIRGWGIIMSSDLIEGLSTCSNSKRLVWNDGEYEDCYNAVALRVCGLDNNIRWWNNMGFEDLTPVFSQGCPQDKLDRSILFHGGSISGPTFAQLPDLTFSRLHNIYFPPKGDLTPAWAKWESLRRLYMEEHSVCKEIYEDWRCEGWETHTCVPTSISSKANKN